VLAKLISSKRECSCRKRADQRIRGAGASIATNPVRVILEFVAVWTLNVPNPARAARNLWDLEIGKQGLKRPDYPKS